MYSEWLAERGWACRRGVDGRNGELPGCTPQKARVKPPLEPAKREFTTLLKMEPNE